MAGSHKILYQGQLPSTAATLYTVPASTETVVAKINYDVTGTTSGEDIEFFVNGTAAANRISKIAGVQQDESGAGRGPLELEATDTIAGGTTTATTVTVTIFGYEKAV